MAGDDPDFLEFFAGEFWPLRRVGFLLTGDWDQAEELAQEAMARTYAVWPRVRGYDRPAAYARKVLLNRHRSLLRRAVVEARHLVASRPDDRHQPSFGGDDLVLWQALRRLPARQREAIVLRYYLDLPEAEVARLLKRPPGHGQVLDPPRPVPPARPPRTHLRRRAPRRQPHPGGRPMTIEDRVRRILADAVADEPSPRGAPLERALRRRRGRPALVGAAALVLVLAAVVGLVAVRDRRAAAAGHGADAGVEDLHRQCRQLPLPLPAGLAGRGALPRAAAAGPAGAGPARAGWPP